MTMAAEGQVAAQGRQTAARATPSHVGAGSIVAAGRMMQVLFGLVVITVLILGWRWRDSGYLSAEEGAGYALGIIGGVLMLLLLLYPLRKKQFALLRWGAIRHWFRLHMVFGVLGPACILFHANFRTGAVNSNVALFSMLLVAGSGLIGRYFYTRIHAGLYGARLTLTGLQQRVSAEKGHLATLLQQNAQAGIELNQLEQWLLRRRSSLVRFLMLPLTAVRCWFVRHRLHRLLGREIERQARDSSWSVHNAGRAHRLARQFISTYIETVRRVAEISAYESLFSWWHVLHLPLFIMMLLAGVVHVIAVHMY